MSIYEGFDPSQVPELFGNRHDPKHTSSDLVEWCSQDLPCARYQALEAENERWKELLHRSADQIYSLTGDFGSEDNDLADEIRAALEARHD